jgi:hypothetical protein
LNIRAVCIRASVASIVAACVAACGHSSVIPGSQAQLSAPQREMADARDGVPVAGSTARTEHLTTWTMVGGTDYNAPNGDYSAIAPYVDWAMTGQGPGNAQLIDELDAAGIVSVYYTDPNRQKIDGPEYSQDETTFSHDCSSNRILITKVPFTFYLMDPSSADLHQLWNEEGNRVIQTWHGSPSYFFEDTADHFNYVTAMPCGFSQQAWSDATNAMDTAFENAVHVPIIYSAGGIHLLGGQVGVSPAVAIDKTTAGGLTEACFGNGFSITRALEFGIDWQTTQAQLLKIEQDGGRAICDANALQDGSANTVARAYVYASYLLTFLPGQSIFSEDFATPSHLTVYPEIYLVPNSPLVAQPTSIDQLLQSGGTYAREYAECDYYGVPVGPCAFVVNQNQTGTEQFPFPGKYNATLRLQGYGVLDGGTATLDGGPPPATVAGEQAVIAIRVAAPRK